MDKIIAQVPGCICIADDIAVFCEISDDKNLRKLMKVATQEGLLFNSAKCIIRKSSISFFGALYTSEGIKPDPRKVEVIRAMLTPQNKDDIHKFMDLINYPGYYIPHLAAKAKPLKDLLKKDITMG